MNTITSPTAFKVNNIHGGESRMDLQKQWIARPADQRFPSLDALAASVNARAERSSEMVVDTRKLEIVTPEVRTKEDLHRLALGLPDGREVAPTHWSFGQLAQLAGAPSGYLRKLPSPIARDCMTYGLRYSRPGDLIKTYDADGSMLAATGPEYGRILDRDVVEAVQQIAGDGTGSHAWKVPGVMDWRTMVYDPEAPITLDSTTLYASDRDVWVFLVDDRNPIEIGKLANGEPDLMFRGFYITNSEVGASALKIAAFYLRAVCCNRIMWGVENFTEISMRHSKYAPSRFIEEARPALTSFSTGSARTLIEGVAKAREAKIAQTDEEALAFLMGRDLNRKRAMEVMEAHEKEEGRPIRSVWDAAQGITAAARAIPNNDDRVELEGAARAILDKVA